MTDFDFEKELQACKEKQTKQLCLLLVVEELVMLRLDGSMIHMPERLRLVEKGYNKAIDDFVEKVKLKYLGVHPDELYEKYYPREICEQVKELAKI